MYLCEKFEDTTGVIRKYQEVIRSRKIEGETYQFEYVLLSIRRVLSNKF